MHLTCGQRTQSSKEEDKSVKEGIFTAALPKVSLEKIADWASAVGFEALEIACWPAGEGKDRKYGGVVHIDVAALNPTRGS